MTNKDELKACPFCDSPPTRNSNTHEWYGCLNAACPASVISTSRHTWNQRPPVAPFLYQHGETVIEYKGPDRRKTVAPLAEDAELDAEHKAYNEQFPLGKYSHEERACIWLGWSHRSHHTIPQSQWRPISEIEVLEGMIIDLHVHRKYDERFSLTNHRYRVADCFYDKETEAFYQDGDNSGLPVERQLKDSFITITHFMPLPTPPAAE